MNPTNINQVNSILADGGPNRVLPPLPIQRLVCFPAINDHLGLLIFDFRFTIRQSVII